MADRETQFAGFAKALVELLRETAYEDGERVIAARAYDLVKHTIGHVVPIELCRMSSEEHTAIIPDLIELPPLQVQSPVHGYSFARKPPAPFFEIPPLVRNRLMNGGWIDEKGLTPVNDPGAELVDQPLKPVSPLATPALRYRPPRWREPYPFQFAPGDPATHGKIRGLTPEDEERERETEQ